MEVLLKMLFTFPESLKQDAKECVEALFEDSSCCSISVIVRNKYRRESEKYHKEEVWNHGVHKYWYVLDLAVISKTEGEEYSFGCFLKAVLFFILNMWRGILYM